jgi:radical SAM protein with 4Fe4S-binding SPASM domain
MTLGQFARIVGNLRGVTEYLYLHVLGEPLSHPLLPTFIEYASNCGFKVAITTNGTLLGRKGEALILSGAYKVNISLHSFEGESAEAQGRYIESCIAFADKASSAGVLTVLRLWNIAEDERGEAAAERNALTLSLLKKYFGEDWTLGARGARIRDKLHIEYGERFEWPDINRAPLGERVFCHGLGDHFAILVDGSVVPCCLDAEGDMTLGNIFESDIRSILSSERAKAIADGFKRKHAAEELCRRCPYARRFKI